MLPYLYINTPPQRVKKLRHECISEIPLLHMLVMGRRVVLGEIISQVGGSFLPVDDEMSLAGAVVHPVKSHFDGLGVSLLRIVVGYAAGALIVYLDWSRRLWVDNFFEGNTDGIGVLAGLVQASHFSLCG